MIDKALQKVMLERMVKITPRMDRIHELLKYDQYWHRFDGKESETHDKSLCGNVFESVGEENYKCEHTEDFVDLPICPNCLKIWYERTEEKFEENQILGNFEINLWDENAEFVRLFIENEGYDKLSDTVNKFIFDYLAENNLLDKLKNKVKNKQQ